MGRAGEAFSSVKNAANNALGATGAIIAGILILGLALGIPIAMMVIGIQNEDKCPVEPWIPVYLIVAGATAIGIVVLGILSSCIAGCLGEDGGCVVGFFGLITFLASLFSFGWFIAGNVWVFKNYDNRHRCDHTTYQFSFWIIIVTYICFVLSCCCGPAVSKASS